MERPDLGAFIIWTETNRCTRKGACTLERKIDPNVTEVPEMPAVLSNLLAYVVEEGQKRFDEQGDFMPFTTIAVGDTLFFEDVDGETPDQMYAFAKHTVEHVRGADAYALCYDGYLDTDKGKAVGLLYDAKEDGTREYHKPIAYIGKAPNFMIFLTPESDPLLQPTEGDDADETAEGEAAE